MGGAATADKRHARIPHMPALDGLRGLAVVGVLLFHADGALAGGYLGVDLFFVLSGYLITALLLAEHRDSGRINLAAFWVRRARRLFPALLSLMVAIAAYMRWFARPDEVSNIRNEAIATLGYVANWYSIYSGKTYWNLFAAPSPLEHTWSLAIEEQFYLLWPLLVWPVLRRRSPRTLLIVTLVLTAASMAAMALLFDPASTSRAYFGTDTRAAGILVGAAFAILLRPGTELSQSAARRLDALGLVGLALIGAAWWTLEGSNPLLYRGGFWATELAALALIACSVAGTRSLIARALSLRPLRWLGSVSYGVYLWHWPVYLVLSAERLPLPAWGVHGVRFAVTFAIAAVSYRFLEQPIRKRGVPLGRPWLVVPVSVAAVVALLVSVRSARALSGRSALRELLPSVGAREDWRVLMLGDSTANTLGWAIRGLRLPTLSVTLSDADGFNLLNDGPKWERWSEVVERVKPDATIVMLSGAFLYGTTVDGGWRTACHPGWTARFEAALDKRLRDTVSATDAVWVTTVPYPLGRYDNAEFRKRVDCINPPLRKVVTSIGGGIKLLDLAEIQCPKGACIRTFEGKPMRPDGVHYVIAPARPIAERTVELISKPVKLR